jgi:single-strand DNA-binding protein
MINKVILVGRLGQDPETRHTQNNNQVTTLSLATSEKYKDKTGQQQEKTEWHKVVLWNRLGEIADKYLKKGSLVYIEGSIQTQEYEKDGQKRYSTQIKGYSLQMLDSKNDKPFVGKEVKRSDAKIEEPFEEDDLPF